MEGDSERPLDLPGFRFHPTEEELMDFYLRKAVQGKRLSFDIIGSLNLYKHEPWDLPGMAKVGEREWYFLVPRDQKPGNGRPNRTTGGGFWKATGSDRPVRSTTDPKRQLGVKKTLVYYQGRAPRGSRTDWVMNEYRLTSSTNAKHKDIVLCKVYRKAIPLKELERRASSEENATPVATSTSVTNLSSSTPGREEPMACLTGTVDVQVEEVKLSSTTGLKRGTLEQLVELQVPKQRMEWLLQETCIRSPWMDFWSPYVNLFNLSGEIMNWS